MDDQNTADPASNSDTVESDGWSSDPNTVERRDRDLPAEGTGRDQPATGAGQAPIAEEQAHQASLPTRSDEA